MLPRQQRLALGRREADRQRGSAATGHNETFQQGVPLGLVSAEWPCNLSVSTAVRTGVAHTLRFFLCSWWCPPDHTTTTPVDTSTLQPMLESGPRCTSQCA